MIALRYDRIDQWLRQWERVLKEPRHVLFGMSFANVVRVTADYLERELSNPQKSVKKVKQGRNWELLSHLARGFNNADPAIDVYRREYPQEIQELEVQLALGQSSGQYDVIAIQSVLRRIYGGPTPQLLMAELVAGLTADESAPDDEVKRLWTITALLLDHVLAKHSVTRIRDMPKQEFARHSVKLLLNRIAAKHTKGHPVISHLVGAWRDALAPAAVAMRHPAIGDDAPASMFDMFDTLSWRDDAYRFLMFVADARPIVHYELLLAPENDPLPGNNMIPEDVAINVGSIVLQQFAALYCKEIIRPILRDMTDDKDSRLHAVGEELGQFVIDQLGFQDRRRVVFPTDHNVVHGTASDSLSDASVRVLSGYLAREVFSLVDSSYVSAFGHELCHLLLRAHREHDIDLTTADGLIGISWIDWIARRTVQDSIWQAVRPVVNQIDDQLATILGRFQELDPEGTSEIVRDFWNTWIDRFPVWAAANTSIIHYVPWENLSRSDAERIVEGLLAALIRTIDEKLVVLRVSGVDSAGTIWSSADITFYDPRLLDYGEKSWGKGWTSAEQTTLARVLVRADTELEARRAALHHLNEVLNALSFAVSARVSAGGFRPEIDQNAYYMRSLTTLRGDIGFGRRRSEMSVGQQITPQNRLAEFATTYDPLLRDASRHPHRLNELQVGFLRALHWYRRGRWEPDPVEQFLFYWIGLEHLFGHERTMVARLPQLHETWMNLPFLQHIHYALVQIEKFIMEDEEFRTGIEVHPELMHCLDDRLGLLRPEMMGELIAIVPENREDVRSYCERFFDEVGNLRSHASDVDTAIEWRRDQFRFRLYCLYQLRNRLAHEALVYPDLPAIDLYVEEIEAVFEDVLVKMSHWAVNPSSKCQSLDDLIERYEPPWK